MLEAMPLPYTISWATMLPMNQSSFLFLLLLFTATASSQAFGQTEGEVMIGETLPDQFMQGLNGPSRNLSDFRGTPLIINVWASWCSPCRAEMKSLERLAWMQSVTRFNVIGISTDDYPERAKQVLKASNATLSHYIDSKLRLENMLGASRIPLTVLVDQDGRVLDKVYGAREWDAAESLQHIRNTFGIAKADLLPGSLEQ